MNLRIPYHETDPDTDVSAAFTAIKAPNVYHHTSVIGCSEPPFYPQETISWNCGETVTPRQSPFPYATECRDISRYVMYTNLDNDEEGQHLSFPPGTGVPVGDGTGIRYLVLNTHYPDLKRLDHGFTGFSEMRMTLVQGEVSEKKAGFITARIFSKLDPMSLSQVEASFPIPAPITMYPYAAMMHTHMSSRQAFLYKVSREGKETLLTKRDPRYNIHYDDLTHANVSLSLGDRVKFGCSFNNSLDTEMEVM